MLSINFMEERSAFVRLFGDYPAVRVIDFLITFREFDYSLTDIAENSNVAWSTIHTFFPNFVKMGIVKHTRNIGRAKLYKLNNENKVVQELVALDNKLIHELADSISTDHN